MNEQIKKILFDLKADVCGIGAIDRFEDAPEGFSPLDIYKDCQSVISFGIALPKGLYKVEPRLVYGHFNEEAAKQVDVIAFSAARKIEVLYGCCCVPIPSDAPNEYWEPDTLTARGMISMKHTAVSCGLGSIGKSSLFLNEKYGNRLTLGAILTDLKLTSDPLSKEICIPGWNICMKNCPVETISDKHVDQLRCRQNTYGKTARGFDTVDCNICRRLCPVGMGC